MLRTIAIALLAATVSACASLNPPLNEDNFLMRIPRGSQLVLKQEIAIPERWFRVAIQDGRVLADRRTIDRSRPYCELETDRVATADNPNVVRPGTFETGGEIRPDLLAQGQSRTVAGAVWIPGEDGHPDRIFRTIVPLASMEQPGVKRLSCEYTENPVYYRHLTINQIRGILGDVFELRLAAG